MTWADRGEQGEGQIQRHAATHLPKGSDPLFTVGPDGVPNGGIVVWQNGVPTIQNISNVVHNLVGQVLAAMGLTEAWEWFGGGDSSALTTPPGGTKTVPGGSDTQVQFNDSGSFGGDAGLTYDKTTNSLSVSDVTKIGIPEKGIAIKDANANSTLEPVELVSDPTYAGSGLGMGYLRINYSSSYEPLVGMQLGGGTGGLSTNGVHARADLTAYMQQFLTGTGFYWDGAASKETDYTIYWETLTSSPFARFVFELSNDGYSTQKDIYLDSLGSFYTDTDNTGSLGKVGTTWADIFANHLTGIEVSDPSAPAANSGIAYFRDNGGGKTQFVVRFPSGAVQVIATEP